MKKLMILLLIASFATAVGMDEKKALLDDASGLTNSTFSDAERADAAGFLNVLLASHDSDYNTYLLNCNKCWGVTQQGHKEVEIIYGGGNEKENSKVDIIGRLFNQLPFRRVMIPSGPAMSKMLLYLMIEFKERQTLQDLEKKLPLTSMEFIPNDDGHCDKVLEMWRAEHRSKKTFGEQMRSASYLPFLIRTEPTMPTLDFTSQ